MLSEALNNAIMFTIQEGVSLEHVHMVLVGVHTGAMFGEHICSQQQIL